MIAYFILLILLFLSFCFSGTETAFTTLSSAYIHEQAKKGNKRAQLLSKLKKNSSKVIGTLLFGNNLVNIALTALSTSLLIDAFGEYGVLISTFAVSFVLLIFAEILPKTYALQNTKNFSFTIAPFLYFCVYLFHPIVIFLDVIVKKIMSLLKMTKTPHMTEDEIKSEIRGIIALQQNSDIMTQERHMLKSILDLSDVTVEDVMLHRSQIVSLNINMSIEEILKFAVHCPYSRIPLWETKRDNIIGILHVKSLLKAVYALYDSKNISIQNYLSKPNFVLNTTLLSEQLHNFKKKREHFALVIDEYGVLQGLVTLEDILEEIVGDIADETDMPEQRGITVIKTPEGAYRLAGETTIRDINRHFKWDLSDDDASTLAGYLMYKIERIPYEGQTFSIDGYTFTIFKKQGNKLVSIDVIPPAF